MKAQVLERLDALSDEALLAAAKKSKVKVEVRDKKRGLRFVPLLEVYPEAKALRRALAKGSKEWSERINAAPLLILAVIDREAALTLARAHVDAVTEEFDPLRRGALAVLGASNLDEDFERVWTIFERTRDGVDELLASTWPGADARIFEAFQAALGTPPDWRLPWDDAKHGALVQLLWRRDFPAGVALIERAGREHPWKWFFAPAQKLRGKRSR